VQCPPLPAHVKAVLDFGIQVPFEHSSHNCVEFLAFRSCNYTNVHLRFMVGVGWACTCSSIFVLVWPSHFNTARTLALNFFLCASRPAECAARAHRRAFVRARRPGCRCQRRTPCRGILLWRRHPIHACTYIYIYSCIYNV